MCECDTQTQTFRYQYAPIRVNICRDSRNSAHWMPLWLERKNWRLVIGRANAQLPNTRFLGETCWIAGLIHIFSISNNTYGQPTVDCTSQIRLSLAFGLVPAAPKVFDSWFIFFSGYQRHFRLSSPVTCHQSILRTVSSPRFAPKSLTPSHRQSCSLFWKFCHVYSQESFSSLSWVWFCLSQNLDNAVTTGISETRLNVDN